MGFAARRNGNELSEDQSRTLDSCLLLGRLRSVAWLDVSPRRALQPAHLCPVRVKWVWSVEGVRGDSL
jgi:hypothetical protein